MIDKIEAQYRPVSLDTQQCNNCDMFRAGNCTLVIGLIEPYGTCRYWEPRQEDHVTVAQRLSEGMQPREYTG